MDNWYYQNRDRILAKMKKFRDENPEIVKERKRKDYLKHRTQVLKRCREYYSNNKEKVLDTASRYVDRNREEINRKKRVYYSLNRNRILEQQNDFYHKNKYEPFMRFRQKTQKANSKGKSKISVMDVQYLYENNIREYGTLTCYLCLKPIKFGKDSLEHKTPFCRGGSNKVENIGIAHILCNSKKHSRTEKEYKKCLS